MRKVNRSTLAGAKLRAHFVRNQKRQEARRFPPQIKIRTHEKFHTQKLGKDSNLGRNAQIRLSCPSVLGIV